MWRTEMQIEIVKADKSMADELAKVKRSAWETTYRGIYPEEKFDNYDFKSQSEKFRALIENKQEHVFVALCENKIVGYMSCGKPIRVFKDYNAEITLLYVLKEFQGLGLGRRFFNVGKKQLENDGFKCFFISCNKYNFPAQKFYEKMGGKIVHVDEDEEDRSLPQVKFEYEIRKTQI